jgi:O-antigen/teichoic acid export membrane protein
MIKNLVFSVGQLFNRSSVILLAIFFTKFGNLDIISIGKLNRMLTIISFLSIISGFGMVEAVQQFLGLKKGKQFLFSIVFYNFVVTLIISVLIFVIDFLSKGVISGFGNTKFQILFGLTIFASIYNVLVVTFNGLNQPLKSGIYQILYVLILSLVSIFSFFYLKNDVVLSCLLGIFFGWFGVSLICLFDLIFAKSMILEFTLDTKIKSFCLDNLISIVCFTILTQTDSIFITQIIKGDEGLKMNAIFKSVAILGFFSKSFSSLISGTTLIQFRDYFRLNQKNIANKLYIKLIIIAVIANLFLLTITFIFGPQILNIVFSSPEISKQGVIILPVLTAIYGIQSLMYITTTYWQAKNMVKILRNGEILFAFLYLIIMLNFVSYGLFVLSLGLLSIEIIRILYFVYNFNFFKNQSNSLQQ